MCLLLAKPSNVSISTQLLKQMWEDNKDGWGIARSIEGELVIDKGMTFNGFMDYIKAIPEHQSAIVHTRWGNIGSKELYNCHPFRINKDFCMFHNGSIQIDRPMKEMSDTFSFAYNIVAPILERTPEVFQTDSFRKVIEEAIGTNNKLIIMRKDGQIVIFNKKQGTEHKGLWLSNNRSLYGQHWGTTHIHQAYTYTPGNNHHVSHSNPVPEFEGYC